MPLKYIHFQVQRFAVVLYITMILAFIPAIVILKARTFTAGKAWVDHTTQVISVVQSIQISLLNAETGERGYALTGSKDFLEPYNDGISVLPDQIKRLHDLVVDNQNQLRRVTLLSSLVDLRMKKFDHVISARRNQGLEEAAILVKTRSGKDTMDLIGGLISQILNEERVLMNERLLRVDDATVILSVALMIIVVRDVFTLVLIVYGIKNSEASLPE